MGESGEAYPKLAASTGHTASTRASWLPSPLRPQLLTTSPSPPPNRTPPPRNPHSTLPHPPGSVSAAVATLRPTPSGGGGTRRSRTS